MGRTKLLSPEFHLFIAALWSSRLDREISDTEDTHMSWFQRRDLWQKPTRSPRVAALPLGRGHVAASGPSLGQHCYCPMSLLL